MSRPIEDHKGRSCDPLCASASLSDFRTRQEERPLGRVHFSLAGAGFAEIGHRGEQNPAHHTSAVGTSGSDTQKHPCWRGSNDTGCTRATAAASTSASVEEASLRSAKAARATPQHLRADFSRSPKTADRHCWIFLVSPPGAAATLPGAGRAHGGLPARRSGAGAGRPGRRGGGVPALRPQPAAPPRRRLGPHGAAGLLRLGASALSAASGRGDSAVSGDQQLRRGRGQRPLACLKSKAAGGAQRLQQVQVTSLEAADSLSGGDNCKQSRPGRALAQRAQRRATYTASSRSEHLQSNVSSYRGLWKDRAIRCCDPLCASASLYRSCAPRIQHVGCEEKNKKSK